MQALVLWLISILGTLHLGSLTNHIVAVGLTLFTASLGLFALNNRRRRTVTVEQQRMAALIKGLHYAGVAHDVLATSRTNPRDHLLSGLRWVLASAALSGALYGSATLQSPPSTNEALRGALVGVIPAAIGVAHLLFSWICSRGQAGNATSYRVSSTARR
jgi:hypothetical protein